MALKALLRLDTFEAYRASGVAAALIGASGAYALVAVLWRRLSLAILAALILLYSPYAFQVNLWERGDIPEVLGLALVPWLLLALWRLWTASTPGQTVLWVTATAAIRHDPAAGP